jgi:hypothetical protein
MNSALFDKWVRASVENVRATCCLWLLGWTQQNLADKRLRRLRYQHRYGVGYVFGLQHLGFVFSGVRLNSVSTDPGANHRDSNIVNPQFFGDGIAQPVQAPL